MPGGFSAGRKKTTHPTGYNESSLHHRAGCLAGCQLCKPPFPESARSQNLMNTTTRAVIMVASGILVANIIDRMFVQPNLG